MSLSFNNVAKVGEGNGTTLGLTKPSGAAVGDLLVMTASVFAPTATHSLTAGWTIHSQSNINSSWRFVVATKQEDGSAIGTLSWDGTSIFRTAIVANYRPDAGNPVTVDAIGTAGAADSSNPITASSVTTLRNPSVVILCGGGGSNQSGSTSSNFTMRSTGDPVVLGDFISTDPPGAVGNKDWTSAGPLDCSSLMLAISQIIWTPETNAPETLWVNQSNWRW